MYIVTPWPNNLYALDLTKPGAPMKWVYEPKPTAMRRKEWHVAMWSIGARLPTDGKIFYNTLDDQTVAVDANTGKESGELRIGDINKGETITMAPLVVNGKVLVGNSGWRNGRTRLDRRTRCRDPAKWRGARIRAGPDSEVLIG